MRAASGPASARQSGICPGRVATCGRSVGRIGVGGAHAIGEAAQHLYEHVALLRARHHPPLPLGTGEDEQAFRDRFPELFESLDENLATCKSVMGELMTWLEGKVGGLAKLDYKGKKVVKYLDDEEAREQLFDDGLVFRTDYPVDEKTITDKLKKATTITDAIKRRKQEEARAKGHVARA